MLPIVLFFIFATILSMLMTLYLLLFESKGNIKERLSKAGKSLEEVKFPEKRETIKLSGWIVKERYSISGKI
jgi:hypothetical protein